MQVLCCVGSPYPEVYLSAQRYRYFVWDLVSVQVRAYRYDVCVALARSMDVALAP